MAAVEPASARRIIALALPALGALAAEPAYVLVDTAVVGHWSSEALAGLAVAGTILTDTAWLLNFLAYGTTAMAARLYGAGRREQAVRAGVQATWLALLLGVVVVVVLELAAGPVTGIVSGTAAQHHAAETWLRIASLGAPFILLSLAGQGWMRGVQDTRRPLLILLAANLLSAVACPLLVYVAALGIAGSAIANVFAQAIAAALFVRALVNERVSLAPDRDVMRTQLVTARDLGIRTAAFQAAFLTAAAVASRMGTDRIGAHQIALQLWTFLALVLDSIAIAAQALIGEMLGAGRRAQARATARRLGLYGLAAGSLFAVGLAAGHALIPRLFTDDAAVLVQASIAWPWFVATQPIGGLLFALDGVLIGAGDVVFMRNVTVIAVLVGFLPLTLAAYHYNLGIGGIWAGLFAFVALRTVAGVIRTAGGKWAT
jgi:putative MATE family efflux protein